MTVLAGRLSSLIRLEHTLFALPYAYVGAIFAVDGGPSFADLFWITVAMAGARSLAMALNRLVDAEIDARNPRTARREIPAGLLSRMQVIAFCLVSLAIFALAVSQLAPITRWLAPIPVIAVRDLPVPEAVHAALPPVARRRRRPGAGRRLGGDHQRRRPEGVPARRRGVLLDRRVRRHLRDHGLRARPPRGPPLIPADYGIAAGLTICRVFHALAVVFMIGAGIALGVGVIYWLGVVICAVLLAYENAIVKPDDLSRVNAAFFNVNAILAGIYLAAVIGDVAVSVAGGTHRRAGRLLETVR